MTYKDPEVRKAYEKKYREDNREKYREHNRRWREDNPGRVKANYRRWKANNPDKARGYGLARRSSRVTGDFFNFMDVRLIDNYYTRICGICRLAIESEYEIDHIVPLTREGTHTLENLQLAHPLCNRTKRNRLPAEMETDIPGLRLLISIDG